MLHIFNCLAVDHDWRFVAVAVMICVVGAFLTVRLFSRARRAIGIERAIWIFLAGFIGGTTTWATHFLAMLGYHAGGTAAFGGELTLLSLFIAVATAVCGIAVASYAGRSIVAEAGGIILGFGIAAMHYTGMAAYEIGATIVWNQAYVWASVVTSGVFGALMVNRVVRPVSRFCRHGGPMAMVLGIASTHFTGMVAMTVTMDPTIARAAETISPALLGFSILSVMVVLLVLVACAYLLDARTTEAAVARYRHLSRHDPLTGLPNRSAFNEEIEGLSRRSHDRSARIAVLSFDLNRFKEINDVHGHAAGDAVLREISVRLAASLRDGEFLARVGGDEFIALTRNYYMRTDASAMANRMIGEIARPIEWNGNTFLVGSSVGIAVHPDDAADIDDLLAQADVAMYRAKQSGENAVCFYDPSMDQAARERNILAMDMRAGLRRGEFQLYYQQQNDTVSGQVIGFEVLLRWCHQTRGMISPVEFIPIAERNGFINELGEWVLRQACLEAARWKNPLSIAVNIAAPQLADMSFPAKVREILQTSGLPAERLELEITETGIVADQQRALVIIRQLKDIGVKIAMDDYGTGYSSLSTLLTFPFDKIKIDRTFVDGVATSAQSAAIVRSTLILASSLDIPVLAEGVETDEHIAFLRQEGCRQVQGYLFGKPGPRAGIEAIVNGSAGSKTAELAICSDVAAA
ncbi:putative bifunctional diguanylate cyclase/phosphodiesterase [Neorhizobium sp. NPDC001467]|uniref:putative bifunctional diguanylate cyclase/phosphodiesterase n=1 Tax=Neorhizobium sp. NPDC001467 TaxID=3390595 RepID=UPI003D00D205